MTVHCAISSLIGLVSNEIKWRLMSNVKLQRMPLETVLETWEYLASVVLTDSAVGRFYFCNAGWIEYISSFVTARN